MTFCTILTFMSCRYAVEAKRHFSWLTSQLQSPFASESQSNDSHMTCKLRAHVQAGSRNPVCDFVFGSNQQCRNYISTKVEKPDSGTV